MPEISLHRVLKFYSVFLERIYDWLRFLFQRHFGLLHYWNRQRNALGCYNHSFRIRMRLKFASHANLRIHSFSSAFFYGQKPTQFRNNRTSSHNHEKNCKLSGATWRVLSEIVRGKKRYCHYCPQLLRIPLCTLRSFQTSPVSNQLEHEFRLDRYSSDRYASVPQNHQNQPVLHLLHWGHCVLGFSRLATLYKKIIH